MEFKTVEYKKNKYEIGTKVQIIESYYSHAFENLIVAHVKQTEEDVFYKLEGSQEWIAQEFIRSVNQ